MRQIKTKEEFDSVINSVDDNTLVILKYSATWCMPCQMLGKTIGEVESSLDNVVFLEADCDEASEELVEMNRVRGIPHMVFYKEGLVVDNTLGNLDKDTLLQKIEENKSK